MSSTISPPLRVRLVCVFIKEVEERAGRNASAVAERSAFPIGAQQFALASRVDKGDHLPLPMLVLAKATADNFDWVERRSLKLAKSIDLRHCEV